MSRSGSKSRDILVLGAGPAALALAEACANLDLQVDLLAPRPTARWNRSFGAFASSLQGLDLDDAILNRFDEPLVFAEADTPLRIDSPYVRFETPALQDLLLARALASGVRFHDGSARTIARVADAMRVDTSERISHEARLVVDATGATSRFAGGAVPRAHQVAYGLWLDVPDEARAMTLMDLRPAEADADSVPTFLYSIPETRTHLFVQETSLATKTPVSMALLERRLRARLARLGLDRRPVLAEERCRIPLGVGIPSGRHEVLPYGAAAGMTQPASGYQIARALTKARVVAESLADSVERSLPERLSSALDVMWSRDERESFALFERGLDIVVDFDGATLRRFLANFFSAPRDLPVRFLSGEARPDEVLRAMWNVFRSGPISLQFQLIRGATRQGAGALVSAFS